MDGVLLQSAESFVGPFIAGAGEMWELLQAEKENVSRDILLSGAVRRDGASDAPEFEPSEESARAIEWRRCENLEDRLRAINDAQDRLIDGGYGTCVECGKRIETKRLAADPAVSLCFHCQELAEGELAICTL